MVLHHLKKKELAVLLKVPTTKDQAELIKLRNAVLLGDLAHRRYGCKHFLGCPHCRHSGVNFLCSTCAYPDPRPGTLMRELQCTELEFGGHAYEETRITECLMLAHKCALLRGASKGLHSFLAAHVEWAEVLIALDGTCTKDWREMTLEEQNAWAAPPLNAVIKQLRLTWSNRKPRKKG